MATTQAQFNTMLLAMGDALTSWYAEQAHAQNETIPPPDVSFATNSASAFNAFKTATQGLLPGINL